MTLILIFCTHLVYLSKNVHAFKFFRVIWDSKIVVYLSRNVYAFKFFKFI